jgi:hypothetical protein
VLSRWYLARHIHPEDGGDTFLQNLDWLSTNYTASYLRNHRCENLEPSNILLSHVRSIYVWQRTATGKRLISRFWWIYTVLAPKWGRHSGFWNSGFICVRMYACSVDSSSSPEWVDRFSSYSVFKFYPPWVDDPWIRSFRLHKHSLNGPQDIEWTFAVNGSYYEAHFPKYIYISGTPSRDSKAPNVYFLEKCLDIL